MTPGEFALWCFAIAGGIWSLAAAALGAWVVWAIWNTDDADV